MKTEKRLSQPEKMLQLLRKKKGQWVGIMDLYLVSGSLCVSTQISALRRGMMLTIENKTERQKNGIVHSFYKLIK